MKKLKLTIRQAKASRVGGRRIRVKISGPGKTVLMRLSHLGSRSGGRPEWVTWADDGGQIIDALREGAEAMADKLDEDIELTVDASYASRVGEMEMED